MTGENVAESFIEKNEEILTLIIVSLFVGGPEFVFAYSIWGFSFLTYIAIILAVIFVDSVFVLTFREGHKSK